MIEPHGDTRKVADAVAVRIGKAARIDLVDRRALPPGMQRLAGGRRQGRELGHRASQIIYPSGGRMIASCPGAAVAAGQSPWRDMERILAGSKSTLTFSGAFEVLDARPNYLPR